MPGFRVFDNAETVLAIAVPGGAAWTRKQFDELTEWVKRPQIGMQGLVYIRVNEDGTLQKQCRQILFRRKAEGHCSVCQRPKGRC